jgi:hypothetical protein
VRIRRTLPRGATVSESPARRRLYRRAGTRSGNELNYGAAGLAAGLAASLATALDAAAPASLAIAAGAAADAAASGAGAVSSDLLQAVAKNIVTSARSRTLRIAFSLGCSVLN